MPNRSDIRDSARLELSNLTTDTVTWTDAELNRFVDRVTGDFSRLIPDEKIQETTVDYVVTAEAWNSDSGVAVTLNNKPIEYNSEVVKQSTTTFTRDTDYTIDYVNGTVTMLAAGSMVDATASTITYNKSRIALDLSSLTTMLMPARVEWPVGSVPQSISQFHIFADILWVISTAGQSQTKQADKDHIRIYYYAEHTAPTDSAVGTFPRFLDEVMVNGVIAYALAMKSREQNLQAIKDGDVAASQLANASGAFAAAEVAMDAIPYSNITTSLEATTTPLAAIKTALDRVDTLIGDNAGSPAYDALAKIATHSGVHATAALSKVDVHSQKANKILDREPGHTSAAQAALAEIPAQSLVKATAALDKVPTHAGTEADAALDKVSTHTAEAGTELDRIRPDGGYIEVVATISGGNHSRFTSTANGLAVGDIVDLENMGVSAYNGRYVVIATQTNDFDLPVAFISDTKGTWIRESPVFDAGVTLDKISANNADANTALDQVAVHVSAATDSVKEALDKIPSAPDFHALADTALDKVPTYLDLVHSEDASTGDLKNAENTWTADDPGAEDFLVDDVGGSSHIDTGAEEYLQAGDNLINAVNLGSEAAKLNQEFALASIEIAKQYADRRKDFMAEADRHTAQAVTYIREAEARMLQVSRYIEEANTWAVAAQRFINEAQGRNEMSAQSIEEATQRHAAASVSISTAAQRNAMSEQYTQEAQTRIAMARSFIDESGERNSISQIMIAEAQQHIAITQILNEEANSQTGISQAYLAEARERNSISARFIDEASQYIAGAQAYIAEAQGRVQEVQTHFEEARGWQAQGELYLGEADRRLSEAISYFRRSAGYRELASQRVDISDRLKLDADDRSRDYWNMLTSRVQQAKPRSQVSGKQWEGGSRSVDVGSNLGT